MLGNFERNVMRSMRIARQQIEHLLAISDSARMNFLAQHALGLGIMDAIVESKFRLGSRIADGPACETARHFDHVLLGIAAVDSERVQFHQFAPVIFVEAALAHGRQFGTLAASKLFAMRSEPLGRLWISAEVIVQIEKHGRTPGCGAEQIAKSAQNAWPDD